MTETVTAPRQFAFSLRQFGRVKDNGASTRELPLKHDGVDLASVIRLVPMHRPAIAEQVAVGIGVDAGVIDNGNAGALQPHPDEAAEIEHGMTGAGRGNEEPGEASIGLREALDEFGPDLIAWLADQRTDRDHNVGTDPRPSFSISAMVASSTPREGAPFQPAWAAPMTRALGSANSTGPQSAVVTPSARPSTFVTIASTRGRESPFHGAVATATSGEWT